MGETEKLKQLKSDKKMQTQQLPKLAKHHKEELVLSSDTFQPKNHSPASFFNSPSLDQKTQIDQVQNLSTYNAQAQATTSPFMGLKQVDEVSDSSNAYFGGIEAKDIKLQ